MLDAGLGTLDYLKSRILPAGAVGSDDWDAALQRLGKAVAGRMQGFCNRVLERVTEQVDEFNALNTVVILRALPVEEITSVQVRTFTGALAEFEGGYQLDQRAGMMTFQSNPGDGTERIVVTYAGGYWLDDGTTQPAGSTALPDELLEAWVMQCQAWAEARRIFGTISLAGMEQEKTAYSPVNLTAEVQAILEPYRRYAGE
jgi:hypothetical protein